MDTSLASRTEGEEAHADRISTAIAAVANLLIVLAFTRRSPRLLLRAHSTRAENGKPVGIGMFAKGGLWGLGFLPTHTMGLTVGGISRKPGVHEGSISIRDYVYLTIAFDHDIVDGAPASRFGYTLVDTIEKAVVLENVGA